MENKKVLLIAGVVVLLIVLFLYIQGGVNDDSGNILSGDAVVDSIADDTEQNTSNLLIPTDLRFEKEDDGSNRIHWVATGEASVTKYTIYRREQGITDWTRIGSVDTVTPSNTGNYWYSNSNITPTTIYEYVVVAVTTDGEESTYSEIVTSN